MRRVTESAAEAPTLAEAETAPAANRTQGVLAEVAAERARQDEQWGGPAHDDQHHETEWYGYRAQFENLALSDRAALTPGLQRESLMKIAALAVAQIESIDRGIR